MAFLVGKKAPEFKSQAVVKKNIVNDFSLNQYLGNYVVFFFYPLDFTFVCPTELHAFEERIQDFEKRNAKVVGCSVDSSFSHLAWQNVSRKEGGIEGVSYPIVSDLTKSIARDFGVLDESQGIAFRGLFLIDKSGVIRHLLVNDLPLGRSVEEALRMLDALIFFEKHGEVCPANWSEGKKGMKASQVGLTEYVAATLEK